MPDRPKEGQQPEALRSLEAAAEHGSRKPPSQGLEAQSDTAPQPASLDKEEETAAKILKAGAEKDTKGMAKAAKDAPPR